MNPNYPQCYCNALLNFSGQNKYKEAQDKVKGIEVLQRLKQLHDSDVEEFEIMRAGVESEKAQIIDTYIKHPELKIATDYHFGELEKFSGELHIIGLSPQNDSHIFACIEKSSLDKVVFYSYGEPPKKLPLTKTYEFADIKQLWKSLDANQPQYNCGRKYSDSDEAKKFFKLFNTLSLDPVTKEEIEKEANSIHEYMAYYYDFFDRYNNDKRIKRKYELREEIIYSSQSLVEDMKSIIDKIVRIYEIEEV